VKYKKKEQIIGKSYAFKVCTSNHHYSTFTEGRANQVALSDARSKIPDRIDSGGCRWYTSPEVRNAKYVASSRRDAVLPPRPRCGKEDPNTGGGLCDLTDFPIRGITIVTYEPGGSRPPCAGGKEGTCTFSKQSDEYAPGSRWVEGPSGEQAQVTLEYEYRWVLNSGSMRISGTGPCPSAPVDTLKPSKKSIGPIDLIRATRCTATNRTYDCCCNCSDQAIKVAQIVPGLSPTYCYNLKLNQAEVDALKTAIEAALIAGACVLAAVLAAKLSAIIIAAALAAKCAYTMVPVTAPCQN